MVHEDEKLGHPHESEDSENRSDDPYSSEPEPNIAPTSSSAVAISVTISVILVVILFGLLAAFTYVYGRNNPGGLAERIANRLEANYKRFGGPGDYEDGGEVELGNTKRKTSCNSNKNIDFQEKSSHSENNNNMTVCF